MHSAESPVLRIDPALCVRCGACVRSCCTGYLRMGPEGPVTGGRVRCIRCWHCAAACPRQAIRAEGETVTAPHADDPVEELILSRRSIRRFKTEPPPREWIEWALDGAAYAPSGKNRHENRWTVVYGRDRCEELSRTGLDHCRETGEAPELLTLAARGIDLLTCGAPVVIVGWSPDGCLNPCVDPVIALHTAELLLSRRGVGGCWGGYLRQLTGHSPALRALLGIPDGCSVQCSLMCGLPDGERYPNIPARPGAEIHWA